MMGGDERNMLRGAGIGGVVRGLCTKGWKGRGKRRGKSDKKRKRYVRRWREEKREE
jgi:hypothetical protein